MTTIKEILSQLEYKKFIGDDNNAVETVIPLDVHNTFSGALMWTNDKNIDKIGQLSCGTIICSDKLKFPVPGGINVIIVDEPRNAFRIVLNKFFNPEPTYGIADSSSVHPTVKYGKSIFIGENVVIEEDCEFGDKVIIGHNTVIHRNTKIGNNVKIGSNCTIGGTGFGYERDIDGEYMLIPHLGNVVFEENVEIGNNTCIDRAVLGSTKLAANVKVDNLVHIAHGVTIGENSLIIANAMIAGSTVIGKNVWVAPSASVINKVIIEDNALVGLGAVVVKSVPASTIVTGNPARPLEKKI